MQEKKRKILKNAIRQLPEYLLKREDVWGRIEGAIHQPDFYSSDSIEQLPVFKAPENVWRKIESRLDAGEHILKRAIGELPVYQAPGKTGDRIDIQEKKKYSIPYYFKRIAVAAVLLLTLSLSLLIMTRQKREADKYEFTNKELKSSPGSGLEMLYNPALCAGNPEVCNSPEFKELASQMKLVNAEFKKLKPMLKQDNFQLRNYYYRLENEKAEIEKQMTRLIIKS